MSGVPSWAVRGAKVLCVRAVAKPPSEVIGRVTFPEVGAVYTLREVRFTKYDLEPAVLLGELVNDRIRVEDDVRGLAWNGEPCFGLRLFRPLITRSQEDDLAIFRPILDQVPETA